MPTGRIPGQPGWRPPLMAPIVHGPIPHDIDHKDLPPDMLVARTEVQKRFYDTIVPWDRSSDCALDYYRMLASILENTTIQTALKTLGKAFTPFTFDIGVTPVQIVPPNKELRGYLFLNPSQTATTVTAEVNIASVAYPAATATPTAASNVSGFRTVRIFMDITASPSGTLTIDAQTQDPQTGNWVTSQADIFAGAKTVATRYAALGELGCDSQFRLLVTVGAGTALTASFTLILKEIQASVIAGQSVFVSGSEDLIPARGFPILGGKSEEFWLRDNTPLFAVAQAAGAQLLRFDLS